jgi:nucleotide-binding universal stress UspA family protein
MMKVVICLSGLDTEELLKEAFSRINPAVQLLLLYVVDTRPAEELGYIRRTKLFSGKSFEQKMEQADIVLAHQVLEEAREFCSATGFSDKIIATELRRGRPEREITHFATEVQADMVVIGVRYKGGNVGPVARFVIDHTPCDLLVVKEAAPQ